MKISFVVPAYNEERYLGDCLQAILKEVENQPYETEIVVINNASTDGTTKVAQSYGVRVVDQPIKGLTRARQKGFESTTGDLVANIDSDVRIHVGWLETAVSEFERDQNLACLSGPFVYYDLSKFMQMLVRIFYLIGMAFYRFTRLLFGHGAMAQGGNFIVRRRALEKIGGFDTGIEFYGEDTDIAYRLSKVGRVEFILKLWVLSSGRRLKGFGAVRTGLTYAINYFSVAFFKKPVHKKYTDIRPTS